MPVKRKIKFSINSRVPEDFSRPKSYGLAPIFKSENSLKNEFQNQIEYKRALNAAKIDQIFAQPFLFSLKSHSSGIISLDSSPFDISTFTSVDYEGNITINDLKYRKSHYFSDYLDKKDVIKNSLVKKILYSKAGVLVSELPKSIHLYKINQKDNEIKSIKKELKFNLRKLDSMDIIDDEYFLATNSDLNIFSYKRNKKVERFKIRDSEYFPINCCKVNPNETRLIVSSNVDKEMFLFDTRQKSLAFKKLFREYGTLNSISWNPSNIFEFTVASNDRNLYTFDMRKMENPKVQHKGHASPVMAVDYKPDGKEFVSGGFDRTIRIFGAGNYFSREVYHTKRMEKIFDVKFSKDGRYVVSGSEDGNLRVWKTNRSEKINVETVEEKYKRKYREKLLEKYGDNKVHKEVCKIKKFRHLPKYLYNERRKEMDMIKSMKRKRENIEKNS